MDLKKLAAELTGDPLGRNYAGMSDAAAAADLNAVLYDAPANSSELLDYLMNTVHRRGTLYGRLVMVATHQQRYNGTDVAYAQLPLGATGNMRNVTGENMSDAATLLAAAEGGRFDAGVVMTSTAMSAVLDSVGAGARGCQVMDASHVAAIKALSSAAEKRQSRAQQLGLPKVEEGHVRMARGK